MAATGSKMIISTPNWNQEFPDLVPQANGDGTDGEDGKNGKEGPRGRYYRTNMELRDLLLKERCYYVEMTSKYFSVTSAPKLASGFPAGRSFVCWSGKVI